MPAGDGRQATRSARVGFYPDQGKPRTRMYKFPVPILDFNVTLNPFRVVEKLYNYFYIFPEYFYKDSAASILQGAAGRIR